MCIVFASDWEQLSEELTVYKVVRSLQFTVSIGVPRFYRSLFDPQDRSPQWAVTREKTLTRDTGTTYCYRLHQPSYASRTLSQGIYVFTTLAEARIYALDSRADREKILKCRIPAGTWVRRGHFDTMVTECLIPMEEI